MFKQKNVNIRANYLIVCNIAAKKYSSKITKQNFSIFLKRHSSKGILKEKFKPGDIQAKKYLKKCSSQEM